MDVIGHRGAAALARENTLDAIEAGLAAGAAGVEVDVRRSTDGALVLMHDPDVGRTTGGRGRVDQMSLAQLRDLGVPTLAEVLATVPREALLILELKGHPWEAGYDPAEPAAHALTAALRDDGDRRVVVSSFNPVALGVVRGSVQRCRTAVLTGAAFDLSTNLAAAVDGGHDECHVPDALIDETFVERAHGAGKRVVVWTVNDPERLRWLEAARVDGVITDDPTAALAALR